jgi:hypothetical protein
VRLPFLQLMERKSQGIEEGRQEPSWQIVRDNGTPASAGSIAIVARDTQQHAPGGAPSHSCKPTRRSSCGHGSRVPTGVPIRVGHVARVTVPSRSLSSTLSIIERLVGGIAQQRAQVVREALPRSAEKYGCQEVLDKWHLPHVYPIRNRLIHSSRASQPAEHEAEHEAEHGDLEIKAGLAGAAKPLVVRAQAPVLALRGARALDHPPARHDAEAGRWVIPGPGTLVVGEVPQAPHVRGAGAILDERGAPPERLLAPVLAPELAPRFPVPCPWLAGVEPDSRGAVSGELRRAALSPSDDPYVRNVNEC